MSRPGYWQTKEGLEIAIVAMESSHIKHCLRYLRRRLLNNRQLNLAPSVQQYQVNYIEGKLAELGNEAQYRNLIPKGDITMEQLLSHIEVWQRDWDRNYIRPAPSVIQPAYPHNAMNVVANWTANLPVIHLPSIAEANNNEVKPYKRPLSLSKSINVEVEISGLTGYIIRGPVQDLNIEFDRRLDFDL